MDIQERRQLENWLKYLHDLLGRFEALRGQRAGLEQQLQPEQPPRARWKAWLIAPVALGFVLLSFTVFARLTGVVTSLVLLPFSGVEYGDPLEGLVRFLMWTVPVVISVGLAAAVVLIRNRVFLPRTNAKIAATNQQRVAHNGPVLAQIRDVDAQISSVDREFQQNIGARFPEYYLNQEAVAFCRDVIQRNLADSIKEALNLYENKLAEDREVMRHQEDMAQQERVRRQIAVGNVVNASIAGAGIGIANANAKAARAQNAANTQRVVDAVNKPKTVWVKKR